MAEAPNRIQEQQSPANDRKQTSPEGAGPLTEDLNAATKRPAASPLVQLGGTADQNLRRRDAVWSEVHYPSNNADSSIDPRATGDPVGNGRP